MSSPSASRSPSIVAYFLMSLPATAMGFGLSVQISALSWILSTKYHLEIDEVGYVWLAGPLAGIIGQLLAGLISDKLWFLGGRRRPMILFGGLVAAAMLWMLPHLELISQALGLTDILLVALTVALALDLAINIGFNPTRALIADLTPEGDTRTKGYTIMQTVSGFFGVGAYFIGLLLGKEALIYVGVALLLVFNIVPTLLIREPRTLTESANADPSRKGTHLKQLLAIYLANAFTWLGVQTMFVFLYAYLKGKMGISDDQQMGEIIDISFLILNTVGFILPATLLSPLAKRVGRVKVHALALTIMAIGYFLVLGLAGSVELMYLVMGLLGIGWASVVSLPFAITTEYVDAKDTGLYMGIFNLSIVIPQVVVSAVFGPIFRQSENLDLIFLICGASLGISALLWILLVKDKKASLVVG